MDIPVEKIEHIVSLFAIPADRLEIRPFGQGLINDTYLLSTAKPTADGTAEGYILQRLNPHVFSNPRLIIENIQTVLAHINHRLQNRRPADDRRLAFPRLYPAHDGRCYVTDPDHGLWRLSEYLPDTVVFDTLDGPGLARETGYILGRFHALTCDLDPHRLHTTLPGFHVTPVCYERYRAVCSGTGHTDTGHTVTGRSRPADIDRCHAYIDANKDRISILQNALSAGRLRLRTIHGDPKLNNILFDRRSRLALSLIDLDTLGPGLIHYDIADCLRSCCNPAGESPSQVESAYFDLDTMSLILDEYIKQAQDFLDTEDYRLLADSIWLLPFELGLRFFTDHLDGDRYFKVDSPGQNLHRALVQFQLARDIDRKLSRIRTTVDELQAAYN